LKGEEASFTSSPSPTNQLHSRFQAIAGARKQMQSSIVRPRESIEWLRRLLDDCGVFAGVSSGAAIAGAAKMASRMDAGTIVTLLPDAGWKYLSSGAWTDDLDEVVERATRINYW